jgi:DNA-binding PadR family transcriptional regulator
MANTGIEPWNSGRYSKFIVQISTEDATRGWGACLNLDLTRSVDSYSELECLILGLIALGATSGYAMRKAMQGMRGNRWSVESGSIYRALRRLEMDGMVEVSGRVGVPNRQRIEYRLTPVGTVVLQTWLERTPESEEFQHIADPIRTRSYFLDLLEPSLQLQTVRTWIAENKKVLEDLKAESVLHQDVHDMPAFALRSLLWQAEARHDWLKKIQEHLKNGPMKRPVAK